jgi:hypothetical protein
MSVEKKLKQIADGHFTGWSWVFDDWKSADRVLAKVEMPAIVCLMPVGGEMTFRRGKVWDSEDVALCFIDKVPRDADGEDNEAVYSRMKREAMRFVGVMNKSGLFEPVEGGVRYDTIIEGTANVLTGVMMSLTIKENEALCL